MFEKIYKINKIIFSILIIAFLFTSFSESEARRRKKKSSRRANKTRYYPNKTKEQAIDIIRSNSESLSEIAGLEPKDNIDTTHKEILNQDGDSGEILDELEKEDDKIVDMEEFTNMWLTYMDDGAAIEVTNYGVRKSDIMDEIMKRLGTPYKFGGVSENAIDCSAFTQRIFLESAGIMLPRVAREQIGVGKKITRKNLQFGDLIFFYTYSKSFASHVGIYLGDDLFAHASSKYGVTVSSLESSYYKKNFIEGRRFSSRDITNLTVQTREELNATRKVRK